jgi:flagellar hook-associated protein 1 FlgK
MSLANILGSGFSALTANQRALELSSQNVANVNTPGYSRVEASFKPALLDGRGAGVTVTPQRVADQYLAAADSKARSAQGAANVRADMMSNAQSYLGDPSNGGTVFSQIDNAFADLSSLSIDPSSAIRRSEVLSSIQNALASIARTSDQIQGQRREADQRLMGGVDQANALMRQIGELNIEIEAANATGRDVSVTLSQQALLIDELAGLIDIRVENSPLGGARIRTNSGALLVDRGVSTIRVDPERSVNGMNALKLVLPGAQDGTAFESQLRSGSLSGLLTVRDNDLPRLLTQLGEYTAMMVDALNAVHNQSNSFPAPQTLAGRQTGLTAADALNFSGVTRLGVVDATGLMTRQIEIDFNTGTISANGAPVSATGTTIGSFVAGLNTALGGSGTASFVDGRLTVSASAGQGVVMSEDSIDPSSRAGRGLSHFFGLNDLVTSSSMSFYDTGMTGADAHGFSPTTSFTMALRDQSGRIIRSVEVQPAGTSLNDLVNQLNQPGVFNGEALARLTPEGRLVLEPVGTRAARVDIIEDTTQRFGTGPSISALFGLGDQVPVLRASNHAIRSDIQTNPNRFSAGQAQLENALVGARVIATGDGAGASAMAALSNRLLSVSSASGLNTAPTTLADFGGRIAGDVGSRAQQASRDLTSAESIRAETERRRTGLEGVNLDEELMNMNQFQQAYAAASRVIQAARDLYDILLNMV